MSEDKDKKKKDKETQDLVRKQLEDLLLNGTQMDDGANEMPVVNDPAKGALPKVQHPNTRNMDFYQVREDLEAEAKKTLKSVMEFYLDAKVIKKNEYVKYKQAVDHATLSNIMFSLKTTQHVIIKVMEEIDMGNIHPRLIEVFGQLQGQLMSIVKHQAAYMITMEEGYKKIAEDDYKIEMAKAIEEQAQQGMDDTIDKLEGSPVKSRGTKALIAGIHKKLDETREEKAIETDFEEVSGEEKIRLTDPANRPSNPMDMNKPLDQHDEDQFDVDDEMF